MLPIEVRADPNEVLAARRRAEAHEAKLIEGYLDQFAKESLGDFDIRRRFRGRPRILAARLKALRDDPRQPAGSRARAAAMVCELGEVACWSAYVALLSGPSELREQALYRLADVQPGTPRPPGELLALVRDRLRDPDPDVREAAVRACEELGVAEAVPGLLAILRAPGPGPKGRAALVLSLDAPSVEAASLAGRLLADPSQKDQPVHLALINFAASLDPAVSRAAVGALAERASSKDATDEDRSIAADMMGRYGTSEDLPALRAAAEPPADPNRRASALGGLIRLGDPGALERAFGLLAADDTRHIALQALAIGGAGVKDASVVERLVATLPKEGQPPFGFTPALLSIGTPKAVEASLALAPRMTPSEQVSVVWTAQGRTVASALARLKELGGLSELPDASLEARVRRRGGDLRAPAPSVFLDVLEAAGFVLGFDTETGEVPSPHDLLLHDLATISGGAFAPEAILQEWKDRKGEEDWDADFTVQFVHGDRLYRFVARNLGDWYDLPSVLESANRALADSGARGRFLTLYTGGQDARILFADPAAARQAAAELLLPLDDDPDRARRDGKAFERLAIEVIRKGTP